MFILVYRKIISNYTTSLIFQESELEQVYDRVSFCTIQIREYCSEKT